MEAKAGIKDQYSSVFEELKRGQNGKLPGFVHSIRNEAFDQFLQLGIPDRKNERYKYTDLNALFQKGFEPLVTQDQANFNLEHVFRCDVPTLDTHLFFVLNGFFQGTSMNEFPEQIKIGSLNHAIKEYPDIIEQHFNQYSGIHQEGLVPLNTALSQDGTFIYVPKNVVCEKPVQVVNLVFSSNDNLIQHRNLILLEENAQIDLVICDHVVSPSKSLTNSVTEVYAGNNAKLNYSKLQNEHNDSSTISNMFIHQEKDSTVNTSVITLHGGLVRNNHSVFLNGSGAENSATGLYLVDRSQHVDNFIQIEHAVPNCLSNELYKGVLDESATGAFTGVIHVYKDAQKTEAFQRNNNIILTEQARMNTKPQLEIYADDVKCSHGATVGQLDEEALFYLQSRGIPYNEARLMLMFGFAHEVIQNISVEALRTRIDELVNRRLRGELSRCDNCEIHRK